VSQPFGMMMDPSAMQMTPEQIQQYYQQYFMVVPQQ
jgi:hypothetical protein